MRRQFPWKSVPCEHCNEQSQPNCEFCLGSGREIRRLSEERRVLDAAITEFVKRSKGFRAWLERKGWGDAA